MTSEQLPFYIGRYLVTGRLGSGGMGVVYLASDERLNRQVAIKRLLKNPGSHSAHLRIRQEALLLAQLNHSNIVQIYDVVEEKGDVALVMEYVDGSPLNFWQRERNPNLPQKIQLLKQICAGLSRAHSIGIIHRDLKADNILIDETNTAKISDFGIAKNWREDSDLTQEQHIAGSWGAMSPEQALGKPLDNRSDLFALGVLAYQLLCEQNPFGDHNSLFVIVDRIVHNQHPPAAKLNPELPASLCQLLDRLLNKDPNQRPLNAAAVSAELDAIGRKLNAREFTPSATRTLTITAEEFHRRRIRRPGTPGRALIKSAAITAGLLLTATLIWLLPEPSTAGKYIAVVLPTETPSASREAKILTSNVLNAIKEALSNREGLYLVPFSESQSLQGQSLRQQARALNVQLLLNPALSCGPHYCELSLELIDTERFSVTANRNVSLSLDSNLGGFEKTLQQVNYLLPNHPPRSQSPQINIEEADYQRYLELLELSYEEQRIDECLDALEELQQKAPLFPHIYELYSQQVFKHRFNNLNMHSVDRLEKFLTRVPAQLANTPEIIGAKLNLAETQYDWEAADEQLALLKFAMPDEAHYYHRKAINLHLRGEYSLALEAENRALAQRTSTNYLVQKALALSYLGDMEGAKPVLHQALQIDSNYIDAISLLAANDLDMGNTQETVRLLESVPSEQLNPLDIYNLCTAQYLQKNYPEADSCFDKLRELTPNDAEPLLFRAEMARELGQPEKAQQLTERAAEESRNREGWENQLMLALAYAQLGHHQQAVEALLETRREARDDIYVNHIRAQIYITTGDLVSTNVHIRKTLQLGQSPIWYRTPRFGKLCTHDSFAGLREEFPELCTNEAPVTQIAQQ